MEKNDEFYHEKEETDNNRSPFLLDMSLMTKTFPSSSSPLVSSSSSPSPSLFIPMVTGIGSKREILQPEEQIQEQEQNEEEIEIEKEKEIEKMFTIDEACKLQAETEEMQIVKHFVLLKEESMRRIKSRIQNGNQNCECIIEVPDTLPTKIKKHVYERMMNFLLDRQFVVIPSDTKTYSSLRVQWNGITSEEKKGQDHSSNTHLLSQEDFTAMDAFKCHQQLQVQQVELVVHHLIRTLENVIKQAITRKENSCFFLYLLNLLGFNFHVMPFLSDF